MSRARHDAGAEFQGLSAVQIAVNVTMLQTFVNVPNLWVFYWTLAIELLFYVGCTVLFATGLLNRRFTAVRLCCCRAGRHRRCAAGREQGGFLADGGRA